MDINFFSCVGVVSLNAILLTWMRRNIGGIWIVGNPLGFSNGLGERVDNNLVAGI
jgi:hypothetical protein